MPLTSRRGFLTAAGGAVAARLPDAEDRPNLVFLLTDDQRWDTLGCMGNRIVQTPHLDRLSREGVTFRNCFVTTAICMTSRASIFTGLHERAHGISSFNVPFAPVVAAMSYPEILRGNGYRTGFIGKWGVGGELPANRFDYFKGFPGQGQYFHPREGRTVHLTRIMEEQALEFLDGCAADRPFCLSVSFKAPHVQDEDPRQFLYDPEDRDLYRDTRIPAPKKADDRYFRQLPEFLQDSEGRRRWQLLFSTPEKYQESVKGYYRLITEVDRVVGRIRRWLEEHGVAKNTVVLFTSDNGFFLGERGLSHKWFMYEESIRVPLIIFDPRLPGGWRNRRRDEMVLNIDMAPTLLDLAQVSAPVSMQGRSLVPLVHRERGSWRREWFYSHLYQNRLIAKSEGIRTRKWKYIRYIESEPLYEELYDLERDPLEENNVAGDRQQANRLARMLERWQAWRDSLGKWRADQAWDDPEDS